MNSTIKQAIQALKGRISDAFAAVEAKGGTLPATQDSANLPAAIASIPAGGGIDISGCVWISGTPAMEGSGDFLAYMRDLEEIHDNQSKTLINIGYGGYATTVFPNLKILEMTEAVSMQFPAPTQYVIFHSIYEEVYLPKWTNPGIASSFSTNQNLRVLSVPSLAGMSGYFGYDSANLIDITIGAQFSSNIPNFNFWSPTNALKTDASDLVTDAVDELGRTIDCNQKQLLYNIRRHFAANLQTITAGYSIRFSANVKAAILADQPTADAFTNKGWTIA